MAGNAHRDTRVQVAHSGAIRRHLRAKSFNLMTFICPPLLLRLTERNASPRTHSTNQRHSHIKHTNHRGFKTQPQSVTTLHNKIEELTIAVILNCLSTHSTLQPRVMRNTFRTCNVIKANYCKSRERAPQIQQFLLFSDFPKRSFFLYNLNQLNLWTHKTSNFLHTHSERTISCCTKLS